MKALGAAFVVVLSSGSALAQSPMPPMPVCDGITDVTPGLNAVLAWMASDGGGGLVLPSAKTCAIASPLVISGSNVALLCESGGDNRHDAPDPKRGCWLKDISATQGYMLEVTAPTGQCGASPGQSYCTSLTGVHVTGISFDGAGHAIGAVRVKSVRASEFSFLYGTGFNGGTDNGVFDIGVVHRDNSPNFGDTCDTQNNDLHNLGVDQVGFTSPAFVWRGYYDQATINSGCDASLNVLRNALFNVGPESRGIVHLGDDGNQDQAVYVSSTGGAPAWEFKSVAGVWGGWFPANDVLVSASFAGGPIVIYGQETYTGCVPGTSCAYAIKFRDMLLGSPKPTIQSGIRPFIDYTWNDLVGSGLEATHWSPWFVCTSGTLPAGSWIEKSTFQKHETLVTFNVKFHLGGPCNAVLVGLPVTAVNDSPIGSVQGYNLADGKVLGGWVDGTNQAIRATPGTSDFPAGSVVVLGGSYDATW